MKKKLKRINVYITEKQYNIIIGFANDKEITFSEMIRRILENYICDIASKISKGF